jgi:hypothetical protein
MNTENQIAINPKEIVLAFIDALNNEDFISARKYLDDDMKFEGVMGSRDGAEVYIKDMEHMKFKYKIQKAFGDENDVCLWYNISMSGQSIFSCGWYHIVSGKIKTFKVLFDPRPLLEQSNKK